MDDQRQRPVQGLRSLIGTDRFDSNLREGVEDTKDILFDICLNVRGLDPPGSSACTTP